MPDRVETSVLTLWRFIEASGAPASGASDCIVPQAASSGRLSRVPGDGTSGAPSGAGSSAAAPPSLDSDRPPAPTPGAGIALAAGRGDMRQGSRESHQGQLGVVPIHQRGASASRTPPCSSSSTEDSPPPAGWLASGRPSGARAPCAAPEEEVPEPEASYGPCSQRRSTFAESGAGAERCDTGWTPSPPWAPLCRGPSTWRTGARHGEPPISELRVPPTRAQSSWDPGEQQQGAAHANIHEHPPLPEASDDRRELEVDP